MNKQKCVLIQANGDGSRMRNFFNLPKHHLYYKDKTIIKTISDTIPNDIDTFIASHYKEDLNYNTIKCTPTKNRIETLKQCLPNLLDYETIIMQDCDTVFKSEIYKYVIGDYISISLYPGDGLKYGFVTLTESLDFKNGNEKTTKSSFITTGIYSFYTKTLLSYLEQNPDVDNLWGYYNNKNPKLFFSEDFINLGDIENYKKHI